MKSENENDTVVSDVRETDFYKHLDAFTACSIAEGFCGGENASLPEQRAAWQYLHDTGLAYTLQGWYGRTVRDLIASGEVAL